YYDSATFNPTTANGSNPNLTVSQSVIMYDPQGQTSNPSAPDSEGDGFATCWGSGSTLANCPAPS
ncbi:MAG: hypothetical protein M1115_09535, partial [Actinobacteria bacterium]|nr:hypothetical protein [Actinomycetota bacterium]